MAKSSFSETWEALILTVYLWRQVQAHKNYETKTQISERGLKEKFDTTSPGVTQYLSRSISLACATKLKLTFVHLYPNISLPESRRWDSGVGREVRDTPSLFFFLLTSVCAVPTIWPPGTGYPNIESTKTHLSLHQVWASYIFSFLFWN